LDFIAISEVTNIIAFVKLNSLLKRLNRKSPIELTVGDSKIGLVFKFEY
jgi:hypothetical protein